MCPYLRKSNGYHYHICGCHRFSTNADQPHYLLLTENNSICYVPQDQLLIRPPKKINNIEIGRYFTRFEGTYYVPNKSLREHYPNDTAAIAKILAK
ncbi:F-box only protein 21-like [Formica exsecta]|nr:F-box only protein 21-like [Formica exsecta]